MHEVSSRELRNNTRTLLQRVEAGESVTITVSGRPVALLRPLGHRPRWLEREEFVRGIVAHQADPGLRNDIQRDRRLATLTQTMMLEPFPVDDDVAEA